MSSSPNAKFTEYCGLNVYDWDPGGTSYVAFSATWQSLEGVEQILGVLFSTTALITAESQLKIQVATDASGTGATDVVEGTAGDADAAGDYIVVAASRGECIATLPTATHFMVLGKSATGTDEGSGVILTSTPKYQQADLLANSIAP